MVNYNGNTWFHRIVDVWCPSGYSPVSSQNLVNCISFSFGVVPRALVSFFHSGFPCPASSFSFEVKTCFILKAHHRFPVYTIRISIFLEGTLSLCILSFNLKHTPTILFLCVVWFMINCTQLFGWGTYDNLNFMTLEGLSYTTQSLRRCLLRVHITSPPTPLSKSVTPFCCSARSPSLFGKWLSLLSFLFSSVFILTRIEARNSFVPHNYSHPTIKKSQFSKQNKLLILKV